MFSTGQAEAVRAAFALAGFDGPLRTLPVESEDERIFVLDQEDLLAPSDVRLLEQVVSQLLSRKVWVVASIEDATVPFG